MNTELADRLAVLVEDRARQTELLPRVVANYRQNENLVVRFGYFKSIARPQIELLSDVARYSVILAPFFGPDRNQPIFNINLGNPDLKPAETDNFDLSMEWYNGNVGVVKFGVFYKRIDSLLESNVREGEAALSDVEIPNDPELQAILDSNDFFFNITVPENNEDVAELWGVEMAVEHQFASLPGAFAGLGIFANYTYTDSSKEQPIDWRRSPVLDDEGNVIGLENERLIISDVSFNQQPEHSGTFGVTYSKYNVDANIAYTSQSRRRNSYEGNGLSFFEEPFETLDARFEYRFDVDGFGAYRVFLEGSDLLRDTSDPGFQTTQGEGNGVTPKYFTDGQFYGGRQIRVGLIGQF